MFKDELIQDLCLRSLSVEERASVVSDWSSNGEWDFRRLELIVPNKVFQRLTPPPQKKSEARDDVMLWSAMSNGLFSVKSAYFLI